MATEILEIETNNYGDAEVEHSSCIVEIETVIANSNTTEITYEKGDDGLSAYKVAVANGFVGTEVEWLASIVPINVDGGIIF